MSSTAAVPEPVMATDATPARAAYSRLAAFGLVLLALAPIVLIVVSVVSGVSLSEGGPMVAAAAAVSLIAAFLAWRFGTWSKIVAIVVALLAAAMLFWLSFGMAYPGSFGDFVPGVAFMLGFVLTLAGAIAAIRNRRRGLSAAAAAREQRVITGATGIVVLAMVVSGALTLLGGGAAVADTDGAPVTMSDFSFAEGTYDVSADEPATFVVHNSDGFTHDFTIPELGVDSVTVLPGADAVVEVPAASAGTYTIYCTLHSDTSVKDPGEAGMAATLVAQ